MPIAPRDLETAISGKLGFTLDPRHKRHRWYCLELDGLPTIRTMVSHSGRVIGKPLEATIARQMGISAPVLRDIVRCTKSKGEYIAAVRKLQLGRE